MSLDKIDVTLVERLAPRSGPTSSADFNATLQEVLNSFAQIAAAWNNDLQPLIDTLPTGATNVPREDRTGDPDPFTNGLDGSQIFVDFTSTDLTEDGKFFSVDLERPFTIKETFVDLENRLTEDIQDVLVELAKVSQNTGITTRQKQAIGARIFDPDQTSASNSLDGLVQLLIRFSNQLELDIAGSSTYLDGLGVQTLDFDILAQLAALQAAHDYDSIFNQVSHDNLDIHTHQYHVDPVGVKNGINREFFLAGTDTFVQGSLQVFVNGVQPRKTTHYSERPDQRGFEFTLAYGAPTVTDNISIHYIEGS